MGLRDMQEAKAGDQTELRVVGREADTGTTDCVERWRCGSQTVPSKPGER